MKIRKDIIIGLVETMLNNYNVENDTRIKFEDLDFDEIEKTIEKVICSNIERNDI